MGRQRLMLWTPRHGDCCQVEGWSRGSLGVWAAILSLLCAGCSERDNSHRAVTYDQFVYLLAGVATVASTPGAEPGQVEAIYGQLLRKYEITEDDLERAIARFEKDPEKWISVLQGILAAQERLSCQGGI